MSHEIRTPLNGIIGFLELLARTRLDDTQADFVRLVRRSAQNLLGVINDVLDLSKIESGRLELEQVGFDPRQELESIVDLFSSGASEKSIHFYCFIDPALPARLIGDPLRIKQVLANFISNALKFTPEGRLVSVEVRVTGSSGGRCRILFSVADEGIGIPKDRQRTILEAYTQGDSSVSRKFGGTGLGLTISQRLITQMGSTLELESDEGKGTRFSFEIELPIADAGRSDGGKRLRVALAHGGPPPLERLIREYLEGLGCDTVPVGDPAEVPHGCDVIVMVHTGGDRDGARAFAATGVPVVVVAEPAQRAEADTLPVARVIYTPLHGSRLNEALLAAKGAGGVEAPRESRPRGAAAGAGPGARRRGQRGQPEADRLHAAGGRRRGRHGCRRRAGRLHVRLGQLRHRLHGREHAGASTAWRPPGASGSWSASRGGGTPRSSRSRPTRSKGTGSGSWRPGWTTTCPSRSTSTPSRGCSRAGSEPRLPPRVLRGRQAPRGWNDFFSSSLILSTLGWERPPWKSEGQPRIDDGLRELRPDDARAHREHLRVVALAQTLRRVHVVRRARVDSFDLVRDDGHPEAGPAHEDPPVEVSRADPRGQVVSDLRVVGLAAAQGSRGR